MEVSFGWRLARRFVGLVRARPRWAEILLLSICRGLFFCGLETAP